MTDFAAFRPNGSQSKRGASHSTTDAVCRRDQGGDLRRTRVEIGLLGRFGRDGADTLPGISVETQETIETEGVRQPASRQRSVYK